MLVESFERWWTMSVPRSIKARNKCFLLVFLPKLASFVSLLSFDRNDYLFFVRWSCCRFSETFWLGSRWLKTTSDLQRFQGSCCDDRQESWRKWRRNVLCQWGSSLPPLFFEIPNSDCFGASSLPNRRVKVARIFYRCHKRARGSLRGPRESIGQRHQRPPWPWKMHEQLVQVVDPRELLTSWKSLISAVSPPSRANYCT